MAPSMRSRVLGSTFVRDAAVATGVLAGLFLLSSVVRVQSVQVPGYLLVVGFDVLEAVFGPVRGFYAVVFALYVVALGVVAAGFAHGVRRFGARTNLPSWRLGLAAGLTVVAVIAAILLYVVYTGTAQSEPVVLLSWTVVILLVLAALVADVFGVTTRVGRPR